MIGEVIRWDRFLPKRSLRVLLVENDDSTRHVVAALLRKCSYFVSAVADGVKAWEFLKEKQYKFDLVLSEVDMPSLSGIDFLSKVTGCDLSRNIPVIMMSSQDSVNVVFKCMLQGAVDFLVKPVRKNELQNLWQHVWRKHSSSNSISPVEEIDDSQAKSQDVFPKYIVIDHEDAESASKNKDNCSDVGDTQSSKPKSDFGTIDGQKPEQLSATEIKNFSKELAKDVDGEAKAKTVDPECALYENCSRIGESNRLSQRNGSLSVNEEISASFGSSKSFHTVPSTQSVEIIDSIGAVSCGHKSAALDKDASIIEKNIAISSLPSQYISPGRQGLIGFPKMDFRERHILKPSAASAFSRYGKGICNSEKRSGAPPATLGTSPEKPTDITLPLASDKEKVFSFSAWCSAPSADHGTEKLRNDQVISATVNDGDNIKTHAPGSAGHSESPIQQHRSHHSSNEVNQNGMTLHPGQLELMPFPFPIGSIPVQSLYAGYGSVTQPLVYTEASPSGPTTVQAVKEVTSGQHGQKGNRSSYDPSSQENHIMYSLEVERTNCAVGREQGDSKTLTHTEAEQMDCHNHCNVDIFGRGANMKGDITDYHYDMAMTYQGDGSRFQAINGNGLEHGRSHHEAALMKFRLKRKDRCFKKKVRYHSRKMLAEQRPRIKGQFVRQATLQSTIAISGEDD